MLTKISDGQMKRRLRRNIIKASNKRMKEESLIALIFFASAITFGLMGMALIRGLVIMTIELSKFMV